MNIKYKFLWLGMFLLVASGGTGWSQGATVWNGPTIVFNHPAGVGTSVRDQLTTNVWLTRDLTEGIFNVAVEAAYTRDSTSPFDTEWAYGSLADYATLGYATWEQWNGKSPPNMIGQSAVVHLISDNIYLSLTFTSWGGRGGGGEFTYERSTPAPVPEPATWALCGLAVLLALPLLARQKYSAGKSNHPR